MMNEDTKDMLIKTAGVTKLGEKPNSLNVKKPREAKCLNKLKEQADMSKNTFNRDKCKNHPF